MLKKVNEPCGLSSHQKKILKDDRIKLFGNHLIG